MSVPNDGTINTPRGTNTKVAKPDSMTRAQNATMPNAIKDWPSTITGFARAMTGIISTIRMQRRAFIFVVARIAQQEGPRGGYFAATSPSSIRRPAQ